MKNAEFGIRNAELWYRRRAATSVTLDPFRAYTFYQNDSVRLARIITKKSRSDFDRDFLQTHQAISKRNNIIHYAFNCIASQ